MRAVGITCWILLGGLLAATPLIVRAGDAGQTLGTWVAAVGTVGALGYAVFSLVHASRREAVARERMQAERVAAWCIGTMIVSNRTLDIDVRYRNASDLPVYDVALRISPDGDWREGHLMVVRDDIGTVGPDESENVTVRYEGPITHNLGKHTPVGIAFRDASGRRWMREPNGELIAR